MPTIRYDYDVFVDCPFDTEYRPMLYALVFAVHDWGFRARCALEIDDSGLVRIEALAPEWLTPIAPGHQVWRPSSMRGGKKDPQGKGELCRT